MQQEHAHNSLSPYSLFRPPLVAAAAAAVVPSAYLNGDWPHDDILAKVESSLLETHAVLVIDTDALRKHQKWIGQSS